MESNNFIREDLLRPLFERYGKELKEDSVIFNEGDEPHHFYIIFDGKVKIVMNDGNNQTILNVLEKGELIGEMSLIDKQTRSASAITVTETKLIILNEEIFFTLMDTQKSFILNVFKTMIDRTKRLTDIVTKLAKKDERTRFLLSFINNIRSRMNPKTNTLIVSASDLISDIHKGINLNQDIIAKYVGQLESMNKIKIDESNNIVIDDLKKLFNSINI